MTAGAVAEDCPRAPTASYFPTNPCGHYLSACWCTLQLPAHLARTSNRCQPASSAAPSPRRLPQPIPQRGATTVSQDIELLGAKDVLAAWQTEGALERQMPLPGGGMGLRIAELHLLEAVLHGWDLATATGQDRAGDPDTVQAAHDRWYGNFPDEARAHTGMFAPSKPAPDDAPALDRLAAYFGRAT
ncbi:TIGR03086 family metal-binding protein [Streptomyces sp. NPDC058989]|uniref:TIGR03086 family metal-binding protein n=1 Tax=Streptomyces sp. NPDC058989 TaxID=3346686 RepID=UPI0036AFDC48